jgi:hypothetical protein
MLVSNCGNDHHGLHLANDFHSWFAGDDSTTRACEFLCATSVFSVSLWLANSQRIANHRDTENTEVCTEKKLKLRRDAGY